MSQHTLTVNGGPTVVYTLTGGRQGPPGPDLVADRAAIEAAAAAAAADALATAADRVQTGLDAVATAADRVQTGLDRVATGQDAAAADADATATAADRVQTGLDRTATAADRVQTGLDKVATAADRVQTGLDRTATGLDAVATAADRVQTGLDRAATTADAVATAADRVQTGTDRTTATAQAAAASASATTATAQANLAASSAASASSVAQQDLSGVTAAALHRSPNAVVAMCVYDTSKDSDGGGWVERCTNTSWFQEALNGTWLAATSPAGFLTELDARSRGATLGTEVSPDPTFSSSAGWTLNGSASIGSNTLTAASVGTGNAIATRSDPVGGNLALATAYQVTVVVGTLTAGAIQVRMGNTGTTLRTLSSAGTHTFTVNPGATGANMSLYASGTTSGTVTRFSIKPVTANVTATGDFFQLGTDGKFYSLSAGSGTTEVFRGNKAKFPRLAAVVAEAASVTIYDLTEPGRPMWMRFVATGNSFTTTNTLGATVTSISRVAALNGMVCVADAQSSGGYGLVQIEFLKDQAVCDRGPNGGVTAIYKANLAGRNTSVGWISTGTNKIASMSVNAVSMTVMPDAPVDPVTGLQVPTIAVATAGGVSVIQNDGTVRNSAATGSWTNVSISPQLLSASTTTTSHYIALKPGALGANFALTTVSGGAAPGFTLGTGAVATQQPTRSFVVARQGARLGLMRLNETNPAASLAASIEAAYNSGWWCGDIRRCWLADTAAGAVDGLSLLTGDDSTFTGGVGSWIGQNGASVASVAGELEVTLSGTAFCGGLRVITTVVGQRYLIAATARRGTSATNGYLGISGITTSTISSTTNAPVTYEFTATATSHAVIFGVSAPVAGQTLYLDDITVKPVIADRTYKAKPATIYGTLTRTAVASAAQLVAYSGWSGSNYVQEPYSSDLDPALAAVTFSAWINYTTAVASTIVERAAASGARIVLGTDGTGKLTATAYDGTTTRTVTTTASYNTTTWLKARASYTTDGTLSISVNGRTVASTYGAPLLTLSNASAVATIGNDRTLATPFPGSIALVKWGATVPSQEAMLWMYEQEKQMFRASAQVTLPSTNSLLDVAYDDLTDTITVVDSGNEASFTGLVRTSTATVPAGTFSKVARGSGVKLAARITTTPGVDITIPSQNLKEELKRTEDAARRARLPMTFDYVGGFTATVTNGSTALTSVTGLSVPSTVNLRGVTVTGTGIPASTVITDIVGTTVYISKPATATNTGVSISMLEFPLPTGYEAEGVATDGTGKQEGSTKSWVKSFDGFSEKVVYGAAPGSTAWVSVRARRGQ